MKVCSADGHLLGVDGKTEIAFVNLGVHTPQATQRGLAAQCVQVRPAKSGGGGGERRDLIGCNGWAELGQLQLEDCAALGLARQGKVQLPVETSGSPEGRVDGIDAVGGANHNHLAPSVETIHHGQQRGHHAAVHVVLARTADRRQTVNFIEEYDGGSEALGLVEQQAQLPLRLPEPLGQHVATLAHEERHLPVRFVACAGQSSRHRRLSRAWRPVEQYSPRHLHSEILKQVWVQQWQENHLLERVDVAAMRVRSGGEQHA